MSFGCETLARVLERDDLWIADLCEQLLREQLWLAPRAKDGADSPAGTYSFRHALFREVLYERLAPSARAELHRKVGTALEQERSIGVSVAASELAMHFDRGRAPMAALRYYAEAAQAALLHVSPAECMTVTERALRLLEQAPAGVERTSLEITLATLRGASAFHSLGAGNEARSAYQRGASLLADVPQHRMRGLLLHGFGFLLNLRAEYGEALAAADRADALACDASDAFLALAACTARGQAYMHQGRPEAARESLERALPALEQANAASEQSFIGFIADPQVTVLAMLSLPLVHVGTVRDARERLQQAYARARRLAQPMALLVTMWFDALCEIRFGNADRVAALADEMHSLVEEFALVQGKTACRWFRGWAHVRRGKPLEGFRQIRAAYEENTALGMIAGSSETLGYAAEALVLHGDWSGAEEQLRQALEIVNTYGERIYLPQLLLTEGAIARARGQHANADASIRRAITEARAQGALWLELLALTELCEHSTATVDDHRALGALVEQLCEARDTTALARAAAVVAGDCRPDSGCHSALRRSTIHCAESPQCRRRNQRLPNRRPLTACSRSVRLRRRRRFGAGKRALAKNDVCALAIRYRDGEFSVRTVNGCTPDDLQVRALHHQRLRVEPEGCDGKRVVFERDLDGHPCNVDVHRLVLSYRPQV